MSYTHICGLWPTICGCSPGKILSVCTEGSPTLSEPSGVQGGAEDPFRHNSWWKSSSWVDFSWGMKWIPYLLEVWAIPICRHPKTERQSLTEAPHALIPNLINVTPQIRIISDALGESPSVQLSEWAAFITFRKRASCWEVVLLAPLTAIFVDLLKRAALPSSVDLLMASSHISAPIPELVVQEDKEYIDFAIPSCLFTS